MSTSWPCSPGDSTTSRPQPSIRSSRPCANDTSLIRDSGKSRPVLVRMPGPQPQPAVGQLVARRPPAQQRHGDQDDDDHQRDGAERDPAAAPSPGPRTRAAAARAARPRWRPGSGPAAEWSSSADAASGRGARPRRGLPRWPYAPCVTRNAAWRSRRALPSGAARGPHPAAVRPGRAASRTCTTSPALTACTPSAVLTSSRPTCRRRRPGRSARAAGQLDPDVAADGRAGPQVLGRAQPGRESASPGADRRPPSAGTTAQARRRMPRPGSPRRSGVGGALPASSEVACGAGSSSRLALTLSPMPTTIASPACSARMPASLPPLPARPR